MRLSSDRFQLRTRNSIRGFVRPLVCWSVGLLVRRSVGEYKSKSGKTSILEAFFMCLCWEGGWWGIGCGLAAPAHPSATML